MFITKCYPTIKHLPLNLLKFLFLLIDFCGHGCTNGRFAIFLWSWGRKKQQKKPRKWRIHLRRKKVWTPLISKLYFFFTFVCFEWFKKLWVCHLKHSKRFWKCGDNETMNKELELQNSNYSYEFKSNIDPFHLQRAYFAHYVTNFSNFCSFGYARWRTTKSFEILETT